VTDTRAPRELTNMWPINVLVIPCYNEEKRLDPALVRELVADRQMHVLVVNDGSTDGTAALLQSIVDAEGGQVWRFDMPFNSGKAEAVRRGMLLALERGAQRVGYADADFATPPGELRRLLACIEGQKLGAVLGCRVARLGTHIERSLPRHLVSRLFACLTSVALGLTVYDTQCGAKWFRDNGALRAALAQPFRSSWAFDVELLGRLLGRWGNGPKLRDDDVLEIPIRAWRDVGGSKVSFGGMAKSLGDMSRMMLTSMLHGPAYTARIETVPTSNTTEHPRMSWSPRGQHSSAPVVSVPRARVPNISMIPELAELVAWRAGLSLPSAPPGESCLKGPELRAMSPEPGE
jgi:dolichyl-phosphate beta-glucosyltransferase